MVRFAAAVLIAGVVAAAAYFGSVGSEPRAASRTGTQKDWTGSAGIVVTRGCVDLPTVIWRGTRYWRRPTLTALDLGRLLAGGTVFRKICGHGRLADAHPARLRAIGGIAPEVALALGGDKHTVWVAPGYFPEQPDFPLHKQIFGPKPRPIPGTCPRFGTLTVVGIVKEPPRGFLSVFSVQFSGRGLDFLGPKPYFRNNLVAMASDIGVRVSHPVGTLPRLRSGQRARVKAVYCAIGKDPPLVLAKEITPLREL